MAVQLYIREQLVDLDGVLSMPLTKQFDDMTNPMAIKNSISRTIYIPATPANNKIFGNIWRIDHINGGLFDPSKRESFTLINDGTVVMTGYIKLSDIKKTANTPHTYEINLFGGLGGFFYALDADDMQDVVMPDNNLTHIINERAVMPYIGPGVSGLHYFLSYQGKYDSFDSKKKQVQNPDTGEYEFIELDRELDEHQYREFRSYYQRPAVSISLLLSQLFEQSGYNVKISDVFKTTPYWQNTFLALAMPSKDGTDNVYTGSIKTDFVPISIPFPDNFGRQMNTGSVGVLQSNYRFTNSDPLIFDIVNDSGVFDISSIERRPVVSYEIGVALVAWVVGAGTFNGRMYNGRNERLYYNIRFYDANNPSVLISTGMGSFPDGELHVDIVAGGNPTGLCHYNGTNIFTLQGSFTPPAGVTRIKAVLEINVPTDINNPNSTNIYWNNRNNRNDSRQGSIYVGINKDSHIKITDVVNVRSGSRVNYTTFMPSGITQLAFVKNFFKPFGMLWEKDMLTNDVSVLTRNEFFAGYKIIDWTDRIDHSKEISISPLNFNFRYGLLGWKESKTARATQYIDTFGTDYGTMKIDTGYEFDSSEKKFIEGNIFTNAVMSSEYDQMFNGRSSETNQDDRILPAFFERKDSVREKSSETMQLLFDLGIDECSPYEITDDTDEMKTSGEYCWGGLNVEQESYRRMGRIITVSGKPYSLDFSKPQQLYYSATDADYPKDSTIYNRFWRDYMHERLSSDTRVMTCYVWITPAEFATWKFNTFVKIENTLWHVNKIENFDALKQQSTKVQLVRVKDITTYINGQKL